MVNRYVDTVRKINTTNNILTEWRVNGITLQFLLASPFEVERCDGVLDVQSLVTPR